MSRRGALFLCAQPLFEARGSPIRVRASLTALAGAGRTVTVVTLPVGPDVPLPPGVTVRRVPNVLRVRRVAIGPSLPKFFFGLLIALRGLFLAWRMRPAVVHGVEEMGLMAWFVGRLSRAAVIYEKHSDPASHAGGGIVKRLVIRTYARVEAFVSRRVDAVVATGPGLARQVAGFRPRGEVACIADVPSSAREADPGATARWRARIDPDGCGVVGLYVGSFADYQGVPLLVESLPGAFAHASTLRFVLVGGGENPELLVRARSAGLGEDRLLHLPSVDPEELPDLLAAADILVSPRLMGDNTPLKVLDYLKAGRAIVATDTEANRLVLDGSTARLVPATAAGIASGLAGLAEDAVARESLGVAARKHFEASFGHRRFGEALEALYARLEEKRA